MSWIGTLLAGLFEALAGWLLKRKSASDAVKAANHQVQAEAHESDVRDDTARKVANDREQNDADLDRASADAGVAGGVRKQSDDIAAAIADANREVR
ncbi:hypothetical protein [Dyella amyloliquefaciens]|uniref:hypothetical protein n=1 Tax=Dyella amyloliquefaciens TaxID=1770545 RepID=UPI00102E9BA2|nr:hypothetical protein [Dyella amyloliquefaciens]